MTLLKILACACLLLFANCVSVIGQEYRYHVEVRNVGKQRVTECEITSSTGFRYRAGTLIPNAGKTILGPFKFPYSDHWTLTWRAASGETLKRDLDLTKALSKSFEGRLVFTIDADSKAAYFSERSHEK